MSFPTITIADWDTAYELLADTPDRFHHVISINNRKGRPPGSIRMHKGRQLLLYFDDIREQEKPTEIAPSPNDVRGILEFAEGIRIQDSVLVHCAAGISRSSATALTILASKMDPCLQSATQAIEHLIESKWDICPNPLIVEIADELLGYGGTLKSVCQEKFKNRSTLWLPPSVTKPEDFE